MLKKIAIGFAILFAVLVGVAFYLDIPRFVIGILTYGRQVREGDLMVGDAVPIVPVYDLDGATSRPLDQWAGDKPLVLIFGSFT